MVRWMLKNIIRPQWVVFGTDDCVGPMEVGIKIFGVIIGCYKSEPIYPETCWAVRKPHKRELGETLRVPT